MNYHNHRSEVSLDRHFRGQMTSVNELLIECNIMSHHDIYYRWLILFYTAPPSQKFARNCLMLLMEEQLTGMRKLGYPFLDLKNTERPMDELLVEYEHTMRQPSVSDKNSIPKVQVDYENSNSRFTGSMSTEETSSSKTDKEEMPPEEIPMLPIESLSQKTDADIKKRLSEELPKSDTACCHKEQINNEKQPNQDPEVADEISELKARICKLEGLFEKSLSKENQSLKPRIDLTLLKKNTRNAIRKLKNFTLTKDPLNFLQTILRGIIDDVPETRHDVLELDFQMEKKLKDLIEESGQRQEKKVREFYETTLKYQENLLDSRQIIIDFKQKKLDDRQEELETLEQRLYQRSHTRRRVCANCQRAEFQLFE